MDRLDLRLVEYFVAVAEELHFGRAAERLHIAQPSLSQQIRRLEVQLGVTLLERNTRSVHLTPAGRALLEEGRRILGQAQDAIRITKAAGGPRLTVGFYGSAATAMLPDVLRVFCDRRPTVEVAVRELALGSIDDIVDGRVDVAFTRLLPDQAEIEVEILAREPRVAALPRAHRLADRVRLTFADLSDERFIVNPAVSGEGPPRRWLAEQRRHGLPGQVAARSRSVQEILTLVAAGQGVSLVPAAVSAQYPRADVRYVPVTDAEAAVTSLAWRPGPVSATVKAFIAAAHEVAVGAAPRSGADEEGG